MKKIKLKDTHGKRNYISAQPFRCSATQRLTSRLYRVEFVSSFAAAAVAVAAAAVCPKCL